MKYILFVDKTTTHAAQTALFKLKFKWPSGSNIQYIDKSVIVVDTSTNMLAFIGKKAAKDVPCARADLSTLLKTGNLMRNSGVPIRVSEDSKLKVLEVKIEPTKPQDLTGVPVLTQDQKYSYYPDNSSTMYIVSVVAQAGSLAWISCNSVLPNGKTTDIVSTEKLTLVDSRDMQESEVARIINSVQHTPTAAKHIVSFMIKQLTPQVKQNESEVDSLPDYTEEEIPDAKLSHAVSRVLTHHTLSGWLRRNKNATISRTDIMRIFNVSAVPAASVLEELRKKNLVKLKNENAARRFYIVC